LARTIGEDIGIDPRRIRLWGMVNRQNKTVRPDVPLTDLHMTVEEAHSRMTGSKGADLRLWAEVAEELDADGEAVWPATPGPNGSPKTDLIVLFLKHFDIEKQMLNGAGHIYISREKKVEDLVPAILKKMGWPEKLATGERVQLKLYEVCYHSAAQHLLILMAFQEIKPSMIEPMKAKQSLKAAELQDGDIICFQLAGSDGKSESDSSVTTLTQQLTLTDLDRGQSIKSDKSTPTRSSDKDSVFKSDRSSLSRMSLDRIETAPAFYDFLVHRREVKFWPVDTTSGVEPFTLVLNTKHSYDQIAGKVGDALDVDPTHLRFTTINATSGKPKAIVKRGQSQNLQTILNPPYSTFSNNNQRNDSLYFEVLDMSLSELDTKKLIKVNWVSEGVTKVVSCSSVL